MTYRAYLHSTKGGKIAHLGEETGVAVLGAPAGKSGRTSVLKHSPSKAKTEPKFRRVGYSHRAL